MPITTHVGPVMIGGAQPQVGDLYGGLQLSRYTDLSPDDAQEFLKMANQFRAQQEEAKSAAIRYQGQMEFQKLIAAGTDASEALRQTAPKIFYQHPQGITAHLNKMMPPATPVPLTTETLPGGGTVSGQYDPRTGMWKNVPLPKTTTGAVQKPTFLQQAKEKAVLREIGAVSAEIAKTIADDPQSPKLEELRREQKLLEFKHENIFRPSIPMTNAIPSITPAADVAAPPPAMTPGVLDTALRQTREMGIATPTNQPAQRNEVRRRTKDGRIAIFDADTKEFIRYAD